MGTEILDLMENRRKAKVDEQKYKELDKLVKKKCEGAKEEWMRPDDIPSELVTALDEVGIKAVKKLLNNIYDTGEIPTDMKRSIYIVLPKKPGTVNVTNIVLSESNGHGWTQDSPSLLNTIRERQLKFFGHIIRAGGLEKLLVLWSAKICGNKSRGRQRTKFTDSLKKFATNKEGTNNSS
ncbi:hypothetical protein PoB_006184300 [Plakobranchus ocellatus]|uniref:Uncharacterized protein n=1 Tax=Plakobranchus ocellatus TaxID=259542 RepID=A0AAV4CTS8_9GAST|nr:hypothetical protein PoB_006184300 [Plakobranchus ocellatus]